MRSAEVKNRSLLAKDFKSGQLPSGAPGAAGAAGAKGGTGPTGLPGSAVAYAAIKSNGDPQPEPGRSKNLVASEHPSAGVYCLRCTVSVNINQAGDLPGGALALGFNIAVIN